MFNYRWFFLSNGYLNMPILFSDMFCFLFCFFYEFIYGLTSLMHAKCGTRSTLCWESWEYLSFY